MGRKEQLIVVSTILTGLGTIVVFLRMIARGWILHQLGKDDWAMLAAWCFTMVYLGVIGLSTRYGTGIPGPEQDPAWLEPALKCVLAIEIVYYIVVYTIKISILLFYLRLARTAFDFFHKATKYTIILLTVFLCVCMIVVFTQCVPIEANWNLFLPERKCINSTAFFYSTSLFNIITDVWILCLPVKILWRVQRPAMEKVALMAVFAMGVFACVASCVRLRTIQIFTESHDPLYDAIPINIWSMIEINIAIICASVPALKALFTSPQTRQRSTGTSGGQYDNSSRSQGQPGTNIQPGQNSTSRAFAMRGLKQSKLPTTITSITGGGDSEERIAGVNPISNSRTDSEENICDYGYGVGITSSKDSNIQSSTREQQPAPRSPTRPGFEIGYHTEVEVKIERRSTIEGQTPSNRSRDINVEHGHRYGARPGRRPGAPPDWNGGPGSRQIQEV